MNQQFTLRNRIILSAGVLIFGLLMTTMSLSAQTSKEYTDAEVDALVADIEANTYNEYILTTDGGTYIMSDVDLAGDAVVKAKDGLTKKPVISDEANTGTFRAFFDIQNGTYNLTVQGLEFIGTAAESMIGISRVRSDNSSISIVDCDIHDFSTSNGFVRCDKAGVSVNVEGCYVYNCNTRLIYLYTNTLTYGDVSVSNTTFANSTGASAIYFRDSGGITAGGNNLTVDHCTFYNIPGGSPVIKVGDAMTGTVSVTNSIFVQVGDSLSNINVLDYCYLAGLEKTVVGTNSFETAPVFKDAENGNFELTNANSFIGSDSKTAGSLKWYTTASSAENEYSVDDVEKLIADISASAHDVYILTTSGGVYDFSDDPDISVSTTIKGAEGLEQKPILSYTANTSSSFGLFRIQKATERITVQFENLEIDCTNDKGNVLRSDSETDLIVKNCYVHGNTNSNGVFRMNVGGGSVSFENTLIANSKQRVICMYTPDQIYGPVNVINSSFNNIAGPVIYYRSSGTVAIGSDVTVNHCTFNEIGGSEGVFKFRDMQGTILIENSIFSAVAGTIDAAFASCNSCYVAGFETAPTASNSIETAPVFVDAATNNLQLTNFDMLTAADLQILGDLSWYTDVFPPKVLAELMKIDETHLTVVFNEAVSAETAALTSSYTLSGIYGLTGNPISATVSDDAKSVVLEVADLSAIAPKQTVVVTVSNVTDILGNVISENNVATYTYLDEVPPVITLTAQEVTNDAGAQVVMQSNEKGMVYLILTGTDQASIADFQKAIAAGQGASATVETTNTDVQVSTAGIQAGSYFAYAVDEYDNISAKSDATVSVKDQVAPLVSVEAQEVNNAANGVKIMVSSNESGRVYLVLEGEAQSTVADLEAAVVAAKAVAGAINYGDTIAALSVAGLVPGSYYAYAVDVAGNISTRSTNTISVSEYVPRLRYYAAEDALNLSIDLVNANDGDTFILTTSGGSYDLAYWHKLTAKVTIMADENLEKRPIISNYIENSTYQTFRLFASGASITLKGLEIDSKYNALYPVKYMIRVASDIGNYYVVADDCYFHGQLKESGAIVKTYGGTHADSLIFRNCIFESFEAVSMTGLSTENSPSWDKLEISNCTFMNIPEGVVVIKDQPSMNKDYPINIDHCTFYNVGSESENVIIADSMRNVTISNSIFANSPSPSIYAFYGDATKQSMVDHYNITGANAPLPLGSAVLGTHTWSLDPQFADAANGDLTLGNMELYTLGGDGLPLGDLRWADVLSPKVMPDVRALSDSTLLIHFNEWMDTTTAIVPANYTISGSAGLTGTAKNAVLYNFRSVVITTGSFMGKVGESVVITVSNVQDLNGNKVDAQHNTVSYTVEEMRPVVFAKEQKVTNAEGQFAVVQTSLASGNVYLILDGEAQSSIADFDVAVQIGNGAKAAVTVSFTDIEVLTYNITPGTYYAYLVDASGVISEKGESAITVSDGIAPVVSAGVQSANNGDGSFVNVQSSENNGRVYIMLDGEPQGKNADFITAVALKKGSVTNVSEANTDVKILTKGLALGIYYAYAIDAAGNISDKGTSPINITEKTGVDAFIQNEIKVFTLHQKVVIASENCLLKVVTIFNINGKVIERRTINAQHFESEVCQPGCYIVSILSENKQIINSKLVIN
ncbi:MAG: DUF5123 domain-containing protein [Prolixibacteraceae bacterium]